MIQFHKTVLRMANSLFNLIVIALLVIAGSYSAYALWDNEQVYAAAGDVQADMIKMKPEMTLADEEEGEGADFTELLTVNEDVCGWVTLDGTAIDHPILQGDTNYTYINTDVYGNFALAGSIFLDSRNDSAFGDTYSLLYGHHMDNSKMFGDLDLYKDEDFFDKNRTGTLILPDRTYNLEIFSCLLVPASEDMIFDPTQWRGSIDKLLKFTAQNALHFDEEMIGEIRSSEEKMQILALSTCSTEFTDARTIVLAVMKPHSGAETGGENS